MARLSGGEALAKQLAREGIRVVFGLPGVVAVVAASGGSMRLSTRRLTIRWRLSSVRTCSDFSR